MSERQMKGITVCADCVYYNLKRHKCNRGCTDEGKPTDHFYADCPLPDVEPVRHAHWITKTRHEHYPSGKEYEEDYCSACGMRGSIEYDYCPHCGAKMDEVSE